MSEENVRFDLANIPENFLIDDLTLSCVNDTITKLESSMRTQSDIDTVYNDWCNILKNHMLKSIPHKTVKRCSTNNKPHRPAKPWWSEKLSDLWVGVCRAEKLWLSCQSRNHKQKFKSEFTHLRKQFDREVQRAKRTHWYSLQKNLLDECNVDQTQFWKSIGKIGVSCTNKKGIPMEVVLGDGSVSFNITDVLRKWQDEFSSLFKSGHPVNEIKNDQSTQENIDENTGQGLEFNNHISIFEVKKAIDGAKRGKAAGFDNIPVEVLKNDTAVSFLHILYNICFDNGTVPSYWGNCIINPIPKSSTSDKRDPLSYRGISLAPTMYKLYCSILNRRLSYWSEQNDKVVDEQNGFRKGRSTTDQILSLTNIIDTRKKLKKSTFCAFIDFKKAYDTIDRTLLWNRLSDIGICGKMFMAIKSLYVSVRSCVRINSLKTD